MNPDYLNYIRAARLYKRAATVMTPEAMQAAQQPPMDPAMTGGQMQATGPAGGQIPPEILQDQMFLQFLAQMAGIQFDPSSGMFIDPQGQPVSAEMIIQAYSEYQQLAAQQGTDPSMMQGGQPPMDPSMMQPPMDPSMMQGGQPPMDPSMMQPPADPSTMQGGQPPMDPSMMQPPADPSMMQGGQPPMDPSMMQPPMDPSMMQGEQPLPMGEPAIPEEVMNQISTAVMAGVESLMQDFSQKLEARFQELNEKIDKLSGDFGTVADTDDRRRKEDMDEITTLRDELETELNPVKQASVVVVNSSAARPLNIFDIINGGF